MHRTTPLYLTQGTCFVAITNESGRDPELPYWASRLNGIGQVQEIIATDTFKATYRYARHILRRENRRLR